MSKKIALVLGSGGARGLAHVGVIKTLLAQGFEITEIVGSSMIIIGGILAVVLAPKEEKKVST